MQTEFIIEWEDDLNKFICEIGETIRCSVFVRDLLDDIAKLYEYEPKIIYSESHYVKVLENELNIVIEIKD